MSKRSKKKRIFVPTTPDMEWEGGCYGSLMAGGKKVRIRVLEEKGRVDFGVDHCFDRWANSIDFQTAMPKSKADWEKKLGQLAVMVSEKRYNPDDAQETWF